jgi:hypothetical protein
MRVRRLLLALLAVGLVATQPLSAHSGRRVEAFLALHPGAELTAEPAPDSPPRDHYRWCLTPHPSGEQPGELLADLRQALDATQDLDAPQVYFRLHQHTGNLLGGTSLPPAGVCATLRAARRGAELATSYDAAATILAATYRTLLAFPRYFLGAPETALARGLRIARDHSLGLEPADQRLVLKGSLESFSQCRDLTPHRFYWAVMVGAADFSILPDPPEAAAILRATSQAAGVPGLTPEQVAYHVPLEAEAAATTPKGRYWVLRILTDRLLQSDELAPEVAELLEVARDKAFPLPLDQGAEVLAAAYRELVRP